MKASIRHIKAIFLKELQDYRRNPIFLTIMGTLFFTFLLLFEISNSKKGGKGMSYVGINEILTYSISFPCLILTPFNIVEEKTKHTLDVFMLSGISPLEFLVGKNLALICVTILTSSFCLISCKMKFKYISFLFILAIIIIISEVILMTLIGIICNNDIQCLMYTMPFIVILLVFPQFSFINGLYSINKFINVSNMNFIINNILTGKGFFYSQYSLFVIAIWFIVPLMLFVIVYKKKKLY